MTPGEAESAEGDLRLADQALRAARMLVQGDALEDAASRLYYAVFHAARAALTVRGLYAKTHSGQVGLFTETFGEAPILGRLLELRAKADYRPKEFRASRGQLEKEIAEAARFVERCRRVVLDAVAKGPDEQDPPPDL